LKENFIKATSTVYQLLLPSYVSITPQTHPCIRPITTT